MVKELKRKTAKAVEIEIAQLSTSRPDVADRRYHLARAHRLGEPVNLHYTSRPWETAAFCRIAKPGDWIRISGSAYDKLTRLVTPQTLRAFFIRVANGGMSDNMLSPFSIDLTDVAWLYIAQRFAIMFFSILPVTLALMLVAALLFPKSTTPMILRPWKTAGGFYQRTFRGDGFGNYTG